MGESGKTITIDPKGWFSRNKWGVVERAAWFFGGMAVLGAIIALAS